MLFRPSVCPTVLHPPHPKLSLIAIPYLPRPVRPETFPVMSQRYEVSDSLLLDGGQPDRPPSAGADKITGWETCASKTIPIQSTLPLPNWACEILHLLCRKSKRSSREAQEGFKGRPERETAHATTVTQLGEKAFEKATIHTSKDQNPQPPLASPSLSLA